MFDGNLKGWVVAVVGGDLRMLEHMRQARAAGAKVQHYGGVPGSEEAAGCPAAPSFAASIKGARIISCPIPGGSPMTRFTPASPRRSSSARRRS